MAQTYVSDKTTLGSARSFSAAPALLNVLLLLLLAFVACASIYLQNPPAAVPAGAPPDVFSAGRAMQDLNVIANSPHPVGSASHAAVREHIFKRLSALGLDPQVQTTTAVNETYLRAGTVNNVMARLKGTGGGKALLLASHYDSAPHSPGASDDGAGVAAMLEAARALQTGAPLQNDVIFLFTDGEEVGLLGAQAFAREHPWAQDVGLVLNFEARGNHGPSVMFETSNGNEWLIEEFARAAPSPISNSFGYEVYKLLPNDTDLTVFKKAGWAGLNFAYIDGLTNYHTPLDNLQHIDQRSLQHHGSYALSLLRHFGNLDLTRRSQRNAVYFNVLGTTLVHYSYAWIIPLTVLALLLMLGVFRLGIRKAQLTLRGIAWGALTFIAAMLLAWLTVTLIWWLINLLANKGGAIFQNSAYYSGYYMLSFVIFTAATFSALLSWSRRKTADANLYAGVLLCFAVLLLLSTFYLPGASYLLMWPLAGGLLALGATFMMRAQGALSLGRLCIFALGALPGLLLLAPTIYFLYTALALGMPALLAVVVVLLLGLLTPCIALPAASKRWLLPGALALAGLALLMSAAFNTGFDAERPQRSDLFYALNADTGKAIWASTDAKLNDWTAQFIARPERGGVDEFFPSRNRAFLRSEAPPAPLDSPAITVLDDETVNEVRRLRLKINSRRQAPSFSVFVEGEVLKAAINGKEFSGTAGTRIPPGSGYNWAIQYAGVPPEGIELMLEVKLSEPLKINVVDRTDGLPEALAASFKPRPDHLIPSPAQYSNATLVSRRFTLRHDPR